MNFHTAHWATSTEVQYQVYMDHIYYLSCSHGICINVFFAEQYNFLTVGGVWMYLSLLQMFGFLSFLIYAKLNYKLKK